ncbi:YkgJ family cysteine cluster protein [Methanolobus sp. WCC5]|uniref:YkgJ family cysteine cluster protein n=1 Tax=Methanolobus sp. WCC5 TaxID=3125785 RepID=UPI003253C020
MGKKIRLSDTPTFDLIVNVLSNYQCPVDCPSLCCKIQNIDFDGKDLKILRKASKTKTEKAERVRYKGSLYYSIEPPCPFLGDTGKCTSYDRRPTVCRIYPFNCDSDNLSVKIYPCDLGIKILSDFLKFRNEKLKLDIPQKLIDDLKASNEIFNTSEDNSDVLLVGITLNNLELFGEYLDSEQNWRNPTHTLLF